MTAPVEPVFLLSMLRSGSTLLQRICAAHPRIAATAEPWVLLPVLYSLRAEGVYAEYHHYWAHRAIGDFIGELPRGEADYRDAIRAFATDLYTRAADEGRTHFLDKTPSYSLIAQDVLKTFPDAKVIVLFRNPLAIIASIVQSFCDRRWKIYKSKPELFTGLANLVEICRDHSDRVLQVRFEDLLGDTEAQVRRICAHLALDFEPTMLDSFGDVKFNGRMGDQRGRKAYGGVARQPLEKWKADLVSPVRRVWCKRYLKWIGPERLALMGYDHDTLMRELYTYRAWSRPIPSDLWHMTAGAIKTVIEPRIWRDKWRRRHDRRRIFEHY